MDMKATKNTIESQCGDCGRTIEVGVQSITITEDAQENGWIIGAGTRHAACWRRVARLIRKADR